MCEGAGLPRCSLAGRFSRPSEVAPYIPREDKALSVQPTCCLFSFVRGAAASKDTIRRGEGRARAQHSRQKYRKPSGPQRSDGQRRGPAGVPKHPAAKLGAAREGVIWPRLIPTSAIHCPLCRGQAGAPRANTRPGTRDARKAAPSNALAEGPAGDVRRAHGRTPCEAGHERTSPADDMLEVCAEGPVFAGYYQSPLCVPMSCLPRT